MAVNVDIVDLELDKILELVRRLRSEGLVQGKDFDFRYHPPNSSLFNDVYEPRRAVFIFYDEHIGMLFKLKHG